MQLLFAENAVPMIAWTSLLTRIDPADYFSGGILGLCRVPGLILDFYSFMGVFPVVAGSSNMNYSLDVPQQMLSKLCGG